MSERQSAIDHVMETGTDLARTLMEQRDTLRAELERVTAERDKLAHWRQKYMELAEENTRLESRIEQLEDSADPEGEIRDYYALMMLCDRQKLEDERDAARAAAEAWKRSAKMWRGVDIWATGRATNRKQYRLFKDEVVND